MKKHKTAILVFAFIAILSCLAKPVYSKYSDDILIKAEAPYEKCINTILTEEDKKNDRNDFFNRIASSYSNLQDHLFYGSKNSKLIKQDLTYELSEGISTYTNAKIWLSARLCHVTANGGYVTVNGANSYPQTVRISYLPDDELRTQLLIAAQEYLIKLVNLEKKQSASSKNTDGFSFDFNSDYTR